MPDQRPVRLCDSCGQVDDHPRHVVATPDGEGRITQDAQVAAIQSAGSNADALRAVLAHIADNSVVMKHMDCCREDGCPDGSCERVTAGAEDLKGEALVEHLTSQTPEEAPSGD